MHTFYNSLIFQSDCTEPVECGRIKKHSKITSLLLRQVQHERLEMTCVHRLAIEGEGWDEGGYVYFALQPSSRKGHKCACY